MDRFTRHIQATYRALNQRDIERSLLEMRQLRLQAEAAIAHAQDRAALQPEPEWLREWRP